MLKLILFAIIVSFFSFSAFSQDNSLQILEQSQITSEETQKIVLQFPEFPDLKIAKTTVTQSDESLIIKLYAEDSSEVYQIEKKGEEISAQKSILPFEVTKQVFSGSIRNTLFETILADIGSEKIALQLSEAFKDDLSSTKGLRVEANYTFEVISYFENGEFVKFGDVIAATLRAGAAISERVLTQNLETLTWSLNHPVLEHSERIFYTPVKASRISSLFNLARKHPVKRRIQPHRGIDFVAKKGTPVYPALEGEIIAMGRAKAKGKFILIQHANGYQTTYDHLSDFSKGLKVGSFVKLENVIGKVGRTGLASGAHLHFGVLRDGLYVNPLYLLKEYTYAQKDDFEELVHPELESEPE